MLTLLEAVVQSLSCVPFFVLHELQHARLPCPTLSPWVCSNSCPLSQWCHPAISSSVIPFSSCSPAFPASGSFPVSQLFTAGGQSIGASASVSVLPVNIQGWFALGLTGLFSLLSKGLWRVSNTIVWKPQFFSTQMRLAFVIETRLLTGLCVFHSTMLSYRELLAYLNSLEFNFIWMIFLLWFWCYFK